MELKLKDVLARIISNQRLSVREISKGSGVSVSSLHEWLSGRAPRNPLQIKAVAVFLGISLDELLFDETPMQSKATPSSHLEEIHGVYQVHLVRIDQDSRGPK